jgi:hypothetical protein
MYYHAVIWFSLGKTVEEKGKGEISCFICWMNLLKITKFSSYNETLTWL